MSDREHDQTPIMCPECKWEGVVADCKHDYMACGNSRDGGDVEPWDYCPECGYPYLRDPDDHHGYLTGSQIDHIYEMAREAGMKPSAAAGRMLAQANLPTPTPCPEDLLRMEAEAKDEADQLEISRQRDTEAIPQCFGYVDD